VASRLTVAVISGLEAVVEDQAEVRLRDGPSMNKVGALNIFYDTMKGL
jgi:hypothetical protein